MEPAINLYSLDKSVATVIVYLKYAKTCSMYDPMPMDAYGRLIENIKTITAVKDPTDPNRIIAYMNIVDGRIAEMRPPTEDELVGVDYGSLKHFVLTRYIDGAWKRFDGIPPMAMKVYTTDGWKQPYIPNTPANNKEGMTDAAESG